MDVVYERCAGLDVHKKNVVACRLIRGEDGRSRHEVKSFETMTQNLLELSDWLAEAEVTHVAMESTGEYWKPVYNILEGHFELLLVNARHIKMVPGRKTDVGDAQWIANLLQHGLLKASFVPPAPQRALRELTRHRSTFIRQRATLSNRIQKVLEGCNIKLASVATDVLGASGKAMLRAMVDGQQDPTQLAQLAKGKLRDKNQALERALRGKIERHHVVVLGELLNQVDSLDKSIITFTAEIEKMCKQNNSGQGNGDGSGGGEPAEGGPGGLATAQAPIAFPCAPAPDVPTPPNAGKAAPPLPPLRYSEAVKLLLTIPGIGKSTAEMIISEIGTNMARFPSAHHLSAWGGVAPANNISGGKILSATTRLGNKALKSGLIQAAQAAARTRCTYLAAQYKRLAKKRGAKRAAMAVAHSILIIIYCMLRDHAPYRELGGDYFEKLKPQATVNNLCRRITSLGYTVELTPLAATP